MNPTIHRRLIDAFRWVDPGPHVTHLVSDASGWWRDPELLRSLGPELGALHPGAQPTAVLAPQISGVLLGPLVAVALGAGFVEAYRDERIDRIADARPPLRVVTEPDHKGRTVALAIRDDRLSPGDRVLVVDDWADSGAQLTALRELIRQAGAEYLGAAVIVDGCPGPVSAALNLQGLLRPADLG